MDFASIRIITDDVDRLAHFYELVTGTPAARPAPVFAEFRTQSATLAIGSTATVAMLGDQAPRPGSNASVIIEFQVQDVDAEFARIRNDIGGADAATADAAVVMEPTTMPWGNRSAIVRDPDGNLVNIFSRPEARL
ncbi:VOC family protein [Leifsonia sp. Le1]|uniref:VOC family protein n=1 Tax=Leifsonia sp. Le1 TaxID=3404918 RepID=UPI003EB8370C